MLWSNDQVRTLNQFQHIRNINIVLNTPTNSARTIDFTTEQNYKDT